MKYRPPPVGKPNTVHPPCRGGRVHRRPPRSRETAAEVGGWRSNHGTCRNRSLVSGDRPQGTGKAGSSVCLPSITSSVGIGGDKRRKNTTNQSSTRDTRFTWKTLLMRVGKTTSANQ